VGVFVEMMVVAVRVITFTNTTVDTTTTWCPVSVTGVVFITSAGVSVTTSVISFTGVFLLSVTGFVLALSEPVSTGEPRIFDEYDTVPRRRCGGDRWMWVCGDHRSVRVCRGVWVCGEVSEGVFRLWWWGEEDG
jgi:hypothetical protein